MGKALFRNSCQRGLLTVFKSTGSKPLSLWDLHLKSGRIKRYIDPVIKSMMFEIVGNNVSTTYMVCPKGNDVLGIVMPYLVMVVKNLHKYWSFEITILADDNVRRRFRVSNFQSTTQITQFCTAMPICLADGWNQIQFNLADFTSRAYSKRFAEVQKIKINANIGIRRIYFAERLMADHELPTEYKLYLPISGRPKKTMASANGAAKENVVTDSSKATAEETPQVAATIITPPKEPDAAKLEEQKQTLEPQGSVEKLSRNENADAETSTSKRASNATLEEQKQESQTKGTVTMSVHGSITSNVQPVGSKTSKHSETVEEAPAEAAPGKTQENEPINVSPRSQSQGRLEDVLEENMKAEEEAGVNET